MKGLACAQCVDLRALPRNDLEPVTCRCGNVTAWWVDGKKGVAQYHARYQVDAFGVGFHNGFLMSALAPKAPGFGDEAWRRLHHVSCEAPGYLFDHSRRDCWVILFKPGTVSDVSWATEEELAAVGIEVAEVK